MNTQTSSEKKEPIINQNNPVGGFFKELKKITIKLKNLSDTILLTGETGVDKSLAAKEIHKASNRKNKTFGIINCSNITDSLFQSELFGHIKGSFTGAHQGRKGIVFTCHGGTLFLDKIGDLPLPQQAKLLRLLEEGEIQPVGSDKVINVNLRIIAATNQNLSDLTKKNLFRSDLFYRINVIQIHIPSLKERKDEIEPLIDYFINEFKIENQLKEKIDSQLIEEIKLIFPHKPWPGNVRQLRSKLRYWIIFGKPKIKHEIKEFYDLDDLPLNIKKAQCIIEELIIRKALKKFNGNRTKTAREISISVPALMYKIKEYGI
ncbi:sigma-54-dependent Fis family transcriptional regulator [Candidatus Parcubacteria bacterium]|nr:sigma-54-dependent Fis family transcriptional regulator [Candidatus Parcubacteria bacterium]